VVKAAETGFSTPDGAIFNDFYRLFHFNIGSRINLRRASLGRLSAGEQPGISDLKIYEVA
jgi:hypothetical protein